MINAPHRAVFRATFTEQVKLKACFHEDGAFFARFGEFFGITPDPFTGEYEYTPTQSTQTVEISGKMATQNIIINPIPSNYGLITWNGSALTVS